jgi:hypothetical protein
MMWRWLADAVVGLHYAFLGYLIVGGFVAWRWRRTIVLHVATAIWALAIVTTSVQCPLTWLQNVLRHRAGLPSVPGGFIETYVTGTFYPSNAQTLSQVLVGLVVIVSWVGYGLRVGHRVARPLPGGRPASGQDELLPQRPEVAHQPVDEHAER